jgi:hypothetical protein
MDEEIRKALNIADLNYSPLTWDERHTTVERAWTEVARLETVELGADKLTNAFAKQAVKLAAHAAFVEMVRECRHLGDHMLRKQINTALELFDEATKGQ